MINFKVGELVKVSPENSNENYEPFRGRLLRVINVKSNTGRTALYDLAIEETDQIVPLSLYHYELTKF